MAHEVKVKERILPILLITILGTILMPIIVWLIDSTFSNTLTPEAMKGFSYFGTVMNLFEKEPCGLLFLLCEGILILSTVWYVLNFRAHYRSAMYKLTDTISIPVPSGEKQQGSAWWLPEKKYEVAFDRHVIDPNDPLIKELIEEGQKDQEAIDNGEIVDFNEVYPLDENLKLFESAGMVVGYEKMKDKETVYTIDHDSHFMCLGTTRCGKTRHSVLQSIGMFALAGESMIISDVKGELTEYTYAFLKRLGYKIVTLDYKEPEKSNCYNLLQPIIDAVAIGAFDDAEEKAADLVSMFVPDPKSSEPIWADGTRSVIKTAILAVVIENVDHPEYQNIYNVYRFIAEMNENVPISKMRVVKKLTLYMKHLEAINPYHKAVSAYSVAKASADSPRTLGSFVTQAMTTLDIFASGKMNAITNKSDFDIESIGQEKTAIFIILPDQKDTYYKVVTALISQIYDLLIQFADSNGGRLPRRVRFILDEFGNFAKIKGFANMETAGGSRGILFALFVQDFAQIDEKYSRETSRIVRSNCETWLYLKSDDTETLRVLSDKLGTYTCTQFNSSTSSNGNRIGGRSDSSNKISRKLLTPDEVGSLNRPYQLVMTRHEPAMLQSPDLSQWYFNTMFGLGDEKHNQQVRLLRNRARTSNDIGKQTEIWGVWNTDACKPHKII